ncbi:SpoVR family protein, partial [candidate division KSB1 bacterium]|nr:SpoVR family protein [candidate division KSB1 bacterium]
QEDSENASPVRLKSQKSYMNSFINPEEFLEEQKQLSKERELEKRKRIPEEPQRDILQFLLEYAPLERWQADILSIIRDEAYYFSPQGQTKIMNEGWATYWHSTIMTRKCLTDAELIDYADHHSGTLMTSTGRLNPYKLGVELFRDIEDRWNKGKFGKEYEECEDWQVKKNWDKNLGLGQEKIFEVRKLYNDLMFIDAFLTPDFCRQHNLFVYEFNDRTDYYEISDRDFQIIKQKLLFSLTNFGQPSIYVENANYFNRAELYLKQKHEGVDLKMSEARDTLANLYKIWTRPVHLETIVDEVKTQLTFDGQEHSEIEID